MDISYGGGNCVYLLPADPEVAVSYIRNRNVIGRRVSADTKQEFITTAASVLCTPKTQNNIQTYLPRTYIRFLWQTSLRAAC